MAIAMAYSTIDVFGVKEAAFLFLLPLWLFMAGLFELIGIKERNKKPDAITELSDVPVKLGS
ncbi:hypothetical protein [Salinimicrobium xinjiangense]|uniref:hypothetical protein n=1 Tax=Salinimicrobium xinjiangense TaxID=438596 RepID=UPI0012EB9E44|nr:hypothetical protein [Salinimicrobium xinjiangense]